MHEFHISITSQDTVVVMAANKTDALRQYRATTGGVKRITGDCAVFKKVPDKGYVRV